MSATPSTVRLQQTTARGRSMSRILSSRGAGIPFLAPAMLLVGGLLIYPFARTVYDSFFTDNGFTRSFTGTGNYSRLITDPVLGRSLLNTVMWVAGTLLLPVLLGLAIAMATSGLRLGKLARSVIVLPYAISGSATSVVWTFILESNGAANQVLNAVGLHHVTAGWLLEWPQNTISMILASTWQATGFSVVLFMVGLQAIPADTIEAAVIDGASGWSMFRKVLLPQLRPVAVVVIGMSLVNSLKSFDLIWVMTQGGPARSSETLAVTMYRETFLLPHIGYGAAVAVVLTVIVLGASWLYLRQQMPRARAEAT